MVQNTFTWISVFSTNHSDWAARDCRQHLASKVVVHPVTNTFLHLACLARLAWVRFRVYYPRLLHHPANGSFTTRNENPPTGTFCGILVLVVHRLGIPRLVSLGGLLRETRNRSYAVFRPIVFFPYTLNKEYT